MRSDYFGPLVKLLILAAIALIIVNDIGSVFATYYRIGDETERVAREGLRNYTLSNRSPDQALLGAKTKAEQDGAVLTGFQVTDKAIRVSVELEAKKTWVAHRIGSLKPYLKAQGQYDLPIR